jgi:hypothetical protein
MAIFSKSRLFPQPVRSPVLKSAPCDGGHAYQIVLLFERPVVRTGSTGNVLDPPAWAAPLVRCVREGREGGVERVAPEDVPSVDPRVVDAERRAVEEVLQDPDILDGPALQNPGEADFPRRS